MTHTPGPWNCTALPRLRLLSTFILDADDEPRALPVTPANAALIAAAPELLAALQRIVNSHGARAALLREGYADAVDEARAAIARATGQA